MQNEQKRPIRHILQKEEVMMHGDESCDGVRVEYRLTFRGPKVCWCQLPVLINRKLKTTTVMNKTHTVSSHNPKARVQAMNK